MKVRNQKGFTLVEIAVVMVVMGLLIVGIFKGLEMVEQAKMKNIANDIEGVVTAIEVYRENYRTYPGDDFNATRWPGVVAGNGDRQLQGAYNAVGSNPPTIDQETNLIWWHLRRAGFLKSDPDARFMWIQPTNSAGGIIGIQDAGGALGLVGVVVCTDVPDKIAIGIDNRLDDGNPSTGVVRSFKGSFTTSLPVAPATSYQEDNSVYVVCKQTSLLRR